MTSNAHAQAPHEIFGPFLPMFVTELSTVVIDVARQPMPSPPPSELTDAQADVGNHVCLSALAFALAKLIVNVVLPPKPLMPHMLPITTQDQIREL